jgi:hypothetical protein
MLTNLRPTIGAALALLLAGTALAITPAQKCESGKNKEAGKYGYCRQKADSKYASTGDAAARTTAFQKCLTKYDLKWPGLETKAVLAGGACPSVGDQAAIQQYLATATTNVATALGGGVLPDCDGDLLACQGDLGTCNGNLTTCQSNLTTCQATPTGQLLKTGQTTCYSDIGIVEQCAGSGQDGELQRGLARAYVDNGDGTITDTSTGLMWEKISDDGSVHDKDTQYTWAGAWSGKVGILNGGSGFAGHTDWRLPNRVELLTLVDLSVANPAVSPPFNTGCVPGCNGIGCSCTSSNYYWSSSTYQDGTWQAWYVAFYDGYSSGANKQTAYWVRAVRGG